MKTLIINGSPRIQGDTESLIHIVKEGITGECKVLDAYRCNISPCVDCRYCWEHTGCAIHDEMQEIYDYIQTCDNIHEAVFSHNTNQRPALEDEQAQMGVQSIIRFFS